MLYQFMMSPRTTTYLLLISQSGEREWEREGERESVLLKNINNTSPINGDAHPNGILQQRHIENGV